MSVFHPTTLIERAKANAAQFPWAAQLQQQAIADAEPWRKLSDDELWALMFGPTIRRSWMVWSNGHCPSCKQPVPMYNWKIAALTEPWKLRCPHCNESFPKNDFGRFYRSGLDEHGVFDPKRADRSLLFHTEHPDPKDPLHSFGVDDGEGYRDGTNCWRFIGAYLIYGQWKQAVLGGIRNLSAAYVATGDRAYAHKAGVLLDRVADLYPTFDFVQQGLSYEITNPGYKGYVSVWHDAAIETRQLTLGYDQIFDGIKDDAALVQFLSARAKQFRLPNPKASFGDIQRNIEERILRDALAHREKITTNYPQTELLEALMLTVLGWPGNRAEVMAVLDPMIEKCTAVDGVTGERGLINYSGFALQALSQTLEIYARVEPGFMDDLFCRHPRLRETYRFFVDTHCLERYYPAVGDCGWFASAAPQFVAVEPPPHTMEETRKKSGRLGAMNSFLWRLHQMTGDPAYAQILYRRNGDSTEDVPHDLFAADPKALQDGVQRVIQKNGAAIQPGSVNKPQWGLAILRSGRAEHARAAWLYYGSGGGHSHFDSMNLGLFAKGLDLMPDFGYPPVQFGGWSSPRSNWYRKTAAHNTVVVDGKDQEPPWGATSSGRTTLWADGRQFRAMRMTAPHLNPGQRFERTVATVDISPEDFYLVDIVRVVGGTDHTKFFHSHFGAITPHGLVLQPAPEYGHDTVMRNFSCDPAPKPGWSVDWTVEDRYRLLPPGSQVRLRYTDLTHGAPAFTCEGWIIEGPYSSTTEAWIPRVLVRRNTDKGPLTSTFVSIIEPFERESRIRAIRRLPMERDGDVAIEITLGDGRRDVVLSAEENDTTRVLQASDIELDGDLGWVRRGSQGDVQQAAFCRGRSLQAGRVVYRMPAGADFLESPLR